MVEGNTQRHHERVEAPPQPQRHVNAEMNAANLHNEGRQLFQRHNDSNGGLSADGQQLHMGNAYDQQGAGNIKMAMAGGGAARPDGDPARQGADAGVNNAIKANPMGEKGQPPVEQAAQQGDGRHRDGRYRDNGRLQDDPGSHGGPSDNPQAAKDGHKPNDLFNKDSTDQQKLAAIRDLANSGVTGITYKDAAGNEHNARLEVEQAGNRQLVHMFERGADGKERTVLRGVSNADGSFEQQRDRNGNFVDYKGKGYDHALGDGASNANPSDQTNFRPGQQRPGQRPDQSYINPDQIQGPQTLPDLTINGVDRSQFASQLANPRIMAAFAGRMHSEVGSQGQAAQLAFAEEVFNRAAARNHGDLMAALSGRYYPTSHPGSSNNQNYFNAINKAYYEGTDTIHGATGNASGHVGFGVRGGHYENGRWVSPNQTAQFGGERFGHEQVDLNKGWMGKYQALKAKGSVAQQQYWSQMYAIEQPGN